MNIFVGILFYVTVAASIIPIGDEGARFIGILVKLLIGVIATVILFNIGAPVWMCVLAISSVLAGFLGALVQDSAGFAIMWLCGLLGNAVLGTSLIFLY